MPHLGVPELIIILVIVLLIFGATRLRDIGKGFGGAINAFRSEVKKGRKEGEEGEVEGEEAAKPVLKVAPQTEPPESEGGVSKAS